MLCTVGVCPAVSLPLYIEAFGAHDNRLTDITEENKLAQISTAASHTSFTYTAGLL